MNRTNSQVESFQTLFILRTDAISLIQGNKSSDIFLKECFCWMSANAAEVSLSLMLLQDVRNTFKSFKVPCLLEKHPEGQKSARRSKLDFLLNPCWGDAIIVFYLDGCKAENSPKALLQSQIERISCWHQKKNFLLVCTIGRSKTGFGLNKKVGLNKM